ncbi:MAG: YggS family pyridoxal phosphate-dependent enzyme [Planctomycetota bacterium]
MPAAREERVEQRVSRSLKERYENVCERIARAAARSGRRAEDVILVAVTKQASMDQVRELLKLGHQDLGENQVQHLVQRAAQVSETLQRQKQLGRGRGVLEPADVRWHMIGHLQRNKVKKAVEVARLIHTVDSLRLAEEIQTVAARRDEPVEVLVQINISGEKSKHGVAPAAARHLIDQIDTMLLLRCRGLMTMAPIVEDPADARPYFERTYELFDDIQRTIDGGERFDILSMGMSHDFEVAVECGANIVRVGTSIFGGDGEGQ